MSSESNMNGHGEEQGSNRSSQILTEDQRRRVNENLGLVAVHLRRFGRNLGEPRRDREREDLFQEGCLGLIQAAITYETDSTIPFASYALSRIHNAVSKAIHNKFTLLRIPMSKRKPPARSGSSVEDRLLHASDHQREPRIHPLGEQSSVASMHDRRNRGTHLDVETVGDRLRRKYERAVACAEQELGAGVSRRGDRDLLIRTLREERFLIPQDEARTALRQIARQTRSSYARVAQCDKRMGQCIRKTLNADPEFLMLQQRARTHPEGIEEPIHHRLERKIAEAAADAFVDHMSRNSSDVQSGAFSALLSNCGEELLDVLRSFVADLAPSARENLLHSLFRSAGGKVPSSVSCAQNANAGEYA